jgi:DNA-binding NarL/FixJ family response regulator
VITGTGDGTIRICLVDDHALIRQALRERFAREADMQVVGEAATAASALALVRWARPDVAVLDVQLPDGDGIAVCRAIRSEVPQTACLMLTGYAGDQALAAAIMAGAAGYVSKDSVAETLVLAVRDVASGKSALDTHAAGAVMDLLRAQLAEGPALSDRDRRLLELVGAGLTDRQIARRLAVPADTAKADVLAVLRKVGLVHEQATGLATKGA